MCDCCCLSSAPVEAGHRSTARRQGSTRWIAGLTLACVLLSATACQDSPASAQDEAAPAVVDTIPGQDAKTVTLTERAAERLGITTVNVAAHGGGTSVPYAAIGYDPDGATWVYTNRQGLTYMREPVTVDDVEADVAMLSSGPEVGTAVVTVGVAELFGTENGIGQ